MHSHPSGQLRVILRRQTEVREVSRVGRITRYAAEIELSSQECRERTPSGRLTGSAVPEMGVDVSADETRLRFRYVKAGCPRECRARDPSTRQDRHESRI